MRRLFNALIPGLSGAVLALSAAAPAEAHAKQVPAKQVHKVCRHSSGTSGLIAGGAGGALVGHALIGGPVGIAAGAVGGAFGGRAIDRTMTAKKRCHYDRRD